MKPVRGIETYSWRTNRLSARSFKLMKPVRGIETKKTLNLHVSVLAFKLMKPVRGIETIIWNDRITSSNICFQINETRSRD